MRHSSQQERRASQNKVLLTFFALAFSFSWLIWLGAILVSRGILDLHVPVIFLAAAGCFGPAVSAAILTLHQQGPGGVSRLIKRGADFRIPLSWFLLVIALPITVAALAMLINNLASGQHLQPEWFSSPGEVALSFVFGLVLGGPLGEEFGWRGFALSRLQRKYGPSRSSLMLGTIWGLWHLPLFLVVGLSQSYVPFWAFMMFTVALSFIFTLVYNNTHGNVLAVLILHTMVNLVLAIFPLFEWRTGASQSGFIIYMLLYVITACIVSLLWSQRRLALSESPVPAIWFSRAPASE